MLRIQYCYPFKYFTDLIKVMRRMFFFFLMLLPITGWSFIYCCSDIIFHMYWSMYCWWFATTRSMRRMVKWIIVGIYYLHKREDNDETIRIKCVNFINPAFLFFTAEGSLVTYNLLYLCGTYCHKNSTIPPGCGIPRQPTYINKYL